MKANIYNLLIEKETTIDISTDEKIITSANGTKYHFSTKTNMCTRCVFANYTCEKIPCISTERKDKLSGVFRPIKNNQN